MEQLAKDLQMKKSSVDKIVYKGRKSRERITHSYRRLVISIANSYRGKGLSLQDLIQVFCKQIIISFNIPINALYGASFYFNRKEALGFFEVQNDLIQGEATSYLRMLTGGSEKLSLHP